MAAKTSMRNNFCMLKESSNIVPCNLGHGLAAHIQHTNPSQPVLTIVSNEVSESLNIEIFDLAGKLLFRQNLKTKSFKVEIDLNLISGAYLIHIINSKNETSISKLFIAR